MAQKILFCATVDYHFQAFHLPYMKWFQQQGWEVHVAAAGEMDLLYVDQKYNISIHRSPYHMQNVKAYQQLRQLITTHQYDIIHTHTPTAGVLARLAARVARKQGTKVLYTAHGFHFYKGSPLQNWAIFYPIERVLSKYTDCLITINGEDFERAKSFPTVVAHVHGVGVDTERFQPLDANEKRRRKIDLGYEEDDFLLFYAAEFNRNKNQQLLLRMLAAIKQGAPRIKLLLAGRGELQEECKMLAKQLGVADCVQFLGYRQDLHLILPACDVAVASSLREGLPVNIMEAMACGLPVVAQDNRGHRELVANGENGWLIKDEVSFSENVKTLYESKDIRERMGQESRMRMNQYSIQHVQRELEEVYRPYMERGKYATRN